MFRLSDEVRSTHGQDGAVVLDIRHGQMYCLNLVGSRMLELLKQGHGEKEITDQVSKEFDASCDGVAADLREFLGVLEQHHLVEPHRSPSVG
jgi:hypothetical protein